MPKDQNVADTRSSTPKWPCPKGKRYRDVYRSMHNPEGEHRERVSFLLSKLSDEELRKVCDTFGLDYGGKPTRTVVQLILMEIF